MKEMTIMHADTIDHQHYEKFLTALKDNFSEMIGNGIFFTTNADHLFDIFLDNLPTDRQVYTCHACRQFVETYGGLVRILENGELIPLVWSVDNIPDFFKPSVIALNKIVSKAKIISVFYTKDLVWGKPATGDWHHISVLLPSLTTMKIGWKTPFQAMAEKKEDFKNMVKALAKFPVEAIDQALSLLKNDALYRSEKCLGVAIWLKELHTAITNNKSKKTNLIWRAVATAPTGFCHPNSSMIGTLLEDIIAGLPFSEIEKRFREKMHPLQYQRPQAMPSAGNIAQAEKIVEKLGIEKSLKRRFAKLSEVKTFWLPKSEIRTEAKSGGIFSHLETKEKTKVPIINSPEMTMTWEKFSRTILPDAERIEYLVPYHKYNYGAFVTAVYPDSPPILIWDLEGERNSVSWYLYSGGSSPANWGIESGIYHEVVAISFLPNLWSEKRFKYQEKGVMFMLKDAIDKNRKYKPGLALFPECLKSDLHSIRSTIEAFSNHGQLLEIEGQHACGLILQDHSNCSGWDVVFRVRTGEIWSKYKLDRWD